MNEWYSPERARQMQSRARLCKWIMFLLASAALAGCVFLCTRVTTGNASHLLAATIGLSTLGGWAVLLLTFTPLPKMVVSALFLCTAMPCAALTAMMSELYGSDRALASRGVALSTALSMVTVPILLLLI